MAFHAGLLNIAGFMAGHNIVAHVTGFVTFSGYYISQNQTIHAAEMLIFPLVFILGSMISGYFVDIRLKLQKEPKYYITFGLMFFLVLFVYINGLLGHWGKFGAVNYKSFSLLVILCLVCGIQNGTISIVSQSVIRTTHLTGLATDLGLGIVRILKKRELRGLINDEGKSNLMRIGIISFFTIGSIVGGFLFERFEYGAFLLPVLISGGLYFLMVYFHTVGKPKRSE